MYALSFKKGLLSSPVVQRNFYIISERNGIEYSYYEGNWENIPDFESLTEISKGRIYDFNLSGFERRPSNFAVEFRGYLKIELGGEYSFYTSSNDGSRLFIDDIAVVNNDGLHGDFERNGKIILEPGIHQIKLHYFDGGGSQALKVSYKGPGIKRQLISVDKLMYKIIK